MKRYSLSLLSIIVTVGLLFAAGCDSTGSSGGGSGTLELSMSSTSAKSVTPLAAKTTAQDSITKAEVTITKVSLVPAEEASDEDSISVLSEGNFGVDLIDLQESLNDTLIADTEIPTGSYEQIRLAIPDGATVTYTNGDTRDVMIASNGLKVIAPFTIDSADDRVSVTLNWNVDQFSEDILRGSPQGRLVITPAIQATVDTSSAGN